MDGFSVWRLFYLMVASFVELQKNAVTFSWKRRTLNHYYPPNQDSDLSQYCKPKLNHRFHSNSNQNETPFTMMFSESPSSPKLKWGSTAKSVSASNSNSESEPELNADPNQAQNQNPNPTRTRTRNQCHARINYAKNHNKDHNWSRIQNHNRDESGTNPENNNQNRWQNQIPNHSRNQTKWCSCSNPDLEWKLEFECVLQSDSGANSNITNFPILAPIWPDSNWGHIQFRMICKRESNLIRNDTRTRIEFPRLQTTFWCDWGWVRPYLDWVGAKPQELRAHAAEAPSERIGMGRQVRKSYRDQWRHH
jgi:hypothetical protein